VGVGTLYRHFPRRSDLIVAVLRHEIDACVAAAETLGATLAPFEAFSAWIERFTEFVGTKQGLAEALHSADPAYEGLPSTLLDSLEPALDGILARGTASGAIRPGVAAREILVAVALLCQPVPGRTVASTNESSGCSSTGHGRLRRVSAGGTALPPMGNATYDRPHGEGRGCRASR
jgi:AcrR family transcriptional regulator